jgi:hypothetical protein
MHINTHSTPELVAQADQQEESTDHGSQLTSWGICRGSGSYESVGMLISRGNEYLQYLGDEGDVGEVGEYFGDEGDI